MKKRVLLVNEFSGLNTGYAVYGRNLFLELAKTGKYELAELACYFDGSENVSTQFPWRIYPAVPRKDNQEIVNAYNSDSTNHFGKFAFEQVVLDFKPDCVCVPPGELVFTKHGYKNIEEVREGELVLTHKNRFCEVKRIMRRQHSGQLVNIRIAGVADTLRLTPEHPVLVYKKRKQTNQKKSVRKIYKDISPEWIEVKDINCGDLVVSVFDTSEHTNIKEIYPRDYLINFYEKDNKVYPSSNYSKIKGIKARIAFDFNFAKFIGYMISDGNCRNGGINISFDDDEEDFCKDAVSLIMEVFGLQANYIRCKDKKMWLVSCHSTILSDFVKSFIGEQKKKYINPIFFSSSVEQIKGLICGLVRGDGCYKRNTISFDTFNKKMAHDYRQLCFRIGFRCNIQKKKTDVDTKRGPYWTCDIYGQQVKEFHSFIRKNDNYWGVIDGGKKSGTTSHIINSHCISTVTKKWKSKYNGQVYNLEVEDDNSYMLASGCVHNCSIRDVWMDKFITESPLRPYYKYIYMPTVDGVPQDVEWLSTYKEADAILTYTDWGKKVLEEYGIKVFGTAAAAVEQCFRPLQKDGIKKIFGLEDFKIVGFVSRNQARKQFPSLLHAFRNFISKTGRKDVLLYLHTSNHDMGWTLSELIKESGVSTSVILTYICRKCGFPFPSFFSDENVKCKRCGSNTAAAANVQQGVSSDVLAQIYNIMDLYIQWSSSEGSGFGAVEAAACGVPVIETDYSAMSDISRKLNSDQIEPIALYKEITTKRLMAVPDQEELTNKLIEFFNLPTNLQVLKGYHARDGYQEHYSTWVRTAKMWEYCIDSIGDGNWTMPPRILPIAQPQQFFEVMSNSEFVKYCIINVLGQPDKLNTYFHLKALRDLNYGFTTALPGTFMDESSRIFSKPQKNKFGKQEFYNLCSNLANIRNGWENIRCQPKQ